MIDENPKVNLGGIVPLSTVDWAGVAAIVIFLRGCPLRCPHCQNKNLQTGVSFEKLSVVEERIKEASPFVGAVVFSGGEPLRQPSSIREMAVFAKKLGLKIGIESCGFYPNRLANLVKEGLVDKVFLDIKAAPRDPEYARAAGRKNVAPLVRDSLEKCIELGVSLEVRTTVFPEMPAPEEVTEIAKFLFAKNLKSLVIQQGLPREDEDQFKPVSTEYLSTLDELVESQGMKAMRRRN
ncbi:MAG: anaerobic ribonucleoside-triphosphate reductase activating protein [Methanotrichaceae archaeon]